LSPLWLRDKTYKNNWIKSLLVRGVRPSLILLEAVPKEQWEEAERRWMFIFLRAGSRLTNMVPGGYGMHYATPEIRRKMGRPGRIPWNKGKKLTPQQCMNHARAMKGKPGYWRGKHLPESARAKLRAAKLGKPTGLKGRKVSDAICDKISSDWIVRDPSGLEITVRNLARFCRSHGLLVPLMNKVAHGSRSHHRNWTCRKL